jgi:hypothetical protein
MAEQEHGVEDEVPGAQGRSCPGGGARRLDDCPGLGQQLPRFRQLQPGERAGGGCSVVVLECCEGGTLRQAMALGLLHSRPGADGCCSLADLPALLEVSLRLSRAVTWRFAAALRCAALGVAQAM